MGHGRDAVHVFPLFLDPPSSSPLVLVVIAITISDSSLLWISG
jgi:hypothetical protein